VRRRYGDGSTVWSRRAEGSKHIDERWGRCGIGPVVGFGAVPLHVTRAFEQF